jgi:FKBP-type peptidyl-prolyl cis-trans isomerase
MKQFFLAVGVSVFASAAVNAQAKPKAPAAKPKAGVAKPVAAVLKNSTDSFSYALGMNIANNLKQQGIEKISNLAMQRALDDVFGKKKVLLDDQQANMCIQQKLQENMTKKNEVVRTKGNAFLEANKKRPGVTTLPSGLQYEVLMKGDANSAMPKIQDTVVAHYKGTLIDGKPFDNSYDRGEPLTIPVGGVIRGWTEVLQLMHIGDKFKVFIPSELGYGERGAGNDIPGGAALIFEMELLGIKPGPVDPSK